MNAVRFNFLVVVVFLSLFLFSGHPVSAQTVLVPTGSVWKYMDDGSDQGTLWQDAGFDDSTWSEGPAQLGYGDRDEATIVSYGPNPNDKYVTTYFRHSFEVADPSQFSFLLLRLLRDDGAVLYVNGTEIQRSNMPAGPINYLTLSSSEVDSSAEDTFFEYYVDATNLNSGTNVFAVEIHQNGITDPDISFDLEVLALPASGATVLLPAGAAWKYLDDGTNQGVAWRAPEFDDSTWNEGPAQLGYGDGDEATVVSYGPDSTDKYITTYFRHSIEVADTSLYSFLLLRVLRDDGAALYLNGSKLQRSNMPQGPIHYQTPASSSVSGDQEDTYFHHYVDTTHLITGTNVFAAEIHQRSATSSDISFDLQVFGVDEIIYPLRKAPYLIYSDDNTEMRVLWQLISSDTCRIEWGYDPLVDLGSENTVEYGDDHQHSHTLTNLTPATTYFYRVTAKADVSTGSFRTAPADDATELDFLAYGDTRSYPEVHDQVAAAMISAYSANPGLKSVLISVGDLVYDGDDEGNWDTEFFDPTYTNIQTMLADLPYQSCRGNHEGEGVLFAKYFPYPFESPYYWSFDYGPAHFVVIDQYVAYIPGSPQYDWIVDDLSTTMKPWRFLVLHEPGWSAGDGHGNEIPVQIHLQPLCLEHGVAIVFGGHNHYYARAYVDGVQHITTGGGGAPLANPILSFPNIVTAASAHHFCTIEIEENELSFAAVSVSGDTLDQFTMVSPWSDVETRDTEATTRGISLSCPFPNPFNPATAVMVYIPKTSQVELDVFNLLGQHIRTVIDAELTAGQHRFSWDGTSDAGRRVNSGPYFYRLRSGGQVLTKELVLLR
ncbi:metallophosphoesterase [Candidatus Eisenbacteria bacterium]|uniref:Metallophosphoesterase n=1 Tax=Eiseniibacteriota bacterium TaxID=2212470 RepID=A0ABV6YL23_UNCEI